MQRCTICGATSREGARFCTSCGTRLDDSGSTTVEETTAQPAVTPTATTISDETPAPESTAQPPSPGDGRDLASGWPEASSTANSDASRSDDPPADDAPASDEPVVPDARDASAPEWPGMDAADPDTDSDSDTSERRDDRDGDDVMAAFTTRDGTPADPDTAATETRHAEDDHDIPADPQRGSSDWEGWSHETPVETERSTPGAGYTPWESASGGVDQGSRAPGDTDAHALLDRLRIQIDRLSDPTTLADRGIDPDELADQLDRWSRAVPDADALLEAVKAVRRSPRDIDTMIRLADVAPDLELLVRHYQAITEQSAAWVGPLRKPRAEA